MSSKCESVSSYYKKKTLIIYPFKKDKNLIVFLQRSLQHQLYLENC